jgi:spermidine/putrescine transport system permease protein
MGLERAMTTVAVRATRAESYRDKRERAVGNFLVWPAVAWMVIFFAIPLLVVVAYSVMTPDRLIQAKLPFTLNNYARFAQATYLSVLWRSVWVALVTTLVAALVGYPLAFYIATRPRRVRNVLLLLIVIPFWTNFLVRTYAWLFILSASGPLNALVVDYLKLTATHLDMINTPNAVLLGLIYGELPFMVLPIYSSVEKFNFRLAEAAYDLGANDWQTFWRVVLPQTSAGLIAGCILVFIPSIGAFVTPDLLGGAQALMIGGQINDAVRSTTGKPFGAALSLVMMGIVALALLIYFRRNETSLSNAG